MEFLHSIGPNMEILHTISARTSGRDAFIGKELVAFLSMTVKMHLREQAGDSPEAVRTWTDGVLLLETKEKSLKLEKENGVPVGAYDRALHEAQNTPELNPSAAKPFGMMTFPQVVFYGVLAQADRSRGYSATTPRRLGFEEGGPVPESEAHGWQDKHADEVPYDALIAYFQRLAPA